MDREEFKKMKDAILNAEDQSQKGSIDRHIEALVNYINDFDSYVTTSSCSGRIVLFVEDVRKGNPKKGCRMLFVSHDTVDENELISRINPADGNVVMKFEPFILHMRCADMESAKKMLSKALESGFKNSGVVLGKKGRFVLAVRTTLGLEVPLCHNGILLVSQEYIKFLVKIANEKLADNRRRADKFLTLLQIRCKKDQ